MMRRIRLSNSSILGESAMKLTVCAGITRNKYVLTSHSRITRSDYHVGQTQPEDLHDNHSSQDRRTTSAVALALDDPPRQPHPPQGGRDQGGRASGKFRLDGVDHDGALFLGPAARGPCRGQAACLADLSRDV